MGFFVTRASEVQSMGSVMFGGVSSRLPLSWHRRKVWVNDYQPAAHNPMFCRSSHISRSYPKKPLVETPDWGFIAPLCLVVHYPFQISFERQTLHALDLRHFS